MFGGMTMIVLLAFTMRLFRGSNAAVGCSSMCVSTGADPCDAVGVAQ